MIDDVTDNRRPIMNEADEGLAQMTIRIPFELRARIAEHAKRERRSTNAQVIIVLEREFPDPASGGVSA